MPAPRWMSQAASEEFSWSQTLGGTRGVIETSAPGLIFVIVYVATHALVPTLVAASAVAVIACIIRLIQRQSIQQAVSGFFGVAVGVILAAATGRGENYFAWGIVTNLAMAAAFALSVLAGRSLVGFFYAMLTGLPTGSGSVNLPCAPSAAVAPCSRGCGRVCLACASPSKPPCGPRARSRHSASLSSPWVCRSSRSVPGPPGGACATTPRPPSPLPRTGTLRPRVADPEPTRPNPAPAATARPRPRIRHRRWE